MRLGFFSLAKCSARLAVLTTYQHFADCIAGPISSVEVFGQRIIILNEHDVAFQLLDERSSVYSDRPTMVFVGEMYVTLQYSQSAFIETDNER